MNTRRGRRFVLVCLLVVLTGLGFQPVKPVTAALVISIQETPPAPAPIQELQPGTPVERSLKSEESHVYAIHLKAGQFLELSVAEKRVDLLAEFFAPDGKRLVYSDVGAGAGKEIIRLLIDVDGVYRLELTAKKLLQPGDYLIEMDVRQPTETDRILIEASTYLNEAQKLYDPRKTDNLNQVVAKYGEALKKYKAINQVLDQGNTYIEIGKIWLFAGEIQKSQEAFQEALKLYSSINDEPNLATVYELMGQAALSNNEDQKGLDLYLQALGLYEKLGNQSLVATAYMAIGIAYNRFGEKQKALKVYRKAIPVLRALEHEAELAATLNNTGRVYDDLGEKQKALEYYFEAMAIEKAQKNQRPIGILHNNIAKIYSDLGEAQKAIEHFKLAVDISSVEKDRIFLTQSLINLGQIYLNLNQMAKATEHYEQAIILAKEMKNQVQEGRILFKLGKIQLQTGNQDRAMELFDQAQAIAIQVGDQVTQSNYYFQKGMVTKNLDEKFALLQKSLDIRQVLNNQIELADALKGMALAERDRGNLASAVQYAERALHLVEKIRSNVTSDQFRTSYFSVVRGYYDIYVDLLIRSRQQQPAAHLLATAFETSERAHARGLIDLMNESRIDIRQGVDPTLLEQERNLKQLLRDKSNRLVSLKTRKTSVEVLQSAEKEIARYSEEYQRVQNQIRQSSPRYSALTQPQPLSLQQIQAQVLTPETILLEYYLGNNVSYVWVVSQAGIEVHELPKQQVVNDLAQKAYESVSVKEPSVRNLSAVKLLTDSTAQTQKTELEMNPMLALSQMILGPVRNQLGTKRIVIVPDGALHLIPFAALPVPQATESQSPNPKWSYLIEHNEIVMLPSASTLAVLRQETATRQPAPKKLAILADPVFSKEDVRVASTVSPSPAPDQPESTQIATQNLTVLNSLEKTKDAPSPGGMLLTRLPGTRKEAKTLYSLIAPTQGKLAMDFEANREFAASQELNQYQMIHFATHGFVNLQNPEFSGLALSLVNKKGEEQDGFLLLSDVYNMNLNAELVVLSACETGLGKQFQGEGLVGLTRGFMYAGSPRIIVSLWSVSDQATAELMERLYEGLLKQGKTPAAALRQAQLAIMQEKRWRSPFYWAAFQLQGEYR